LLGLPATNKSIKTTVAGVPFHLPMPFQRVAGGCQWILWQFGEFFVDNRTTTSAPN
jgi:hypothetical protein